MFDASSVTSSDPAQVCQLLDDLTEELIDLDVRCPTSPEVPGLLARLERFRAVLDGASLALLERTDAEGLHETDGLVSTRSWLKQHTGTAGDTAARRLKLARDLRDAPLLLAALRNGRITMDAARVVCSARRPSTIEAFEHAEAMFVEWAETLHIDDLGTAVRRWLELADADGSDPERHWKDRSFWLSQTLGGSWQLRGQLTPEQGARLRARLDEQIERLERDETLDEGEPMPTPAQRAADALSSLAELPHASSGVRAPRARLTVLTTVDDLRLGLGARLSTGQWLDGAAVARLACDAELLQAYHDATGRLLGTYSTARFVDHRLRSALTAMFPTCIVPGCDVPSSECDMHHVIPWQLGGPTDTDNVRPLCQHHHTLCHQQRWVIRDRALLADATSATGARPARFGDGYPVDTVTTTTDGRFEIHRPGRPPINQASRWDRSRAP